jgi:FG-GAP repeat
MRRGIGILLPTTLLLLVVGPLPAEAGGFGSTSTAVSSAAVRADFNGDSRADLAIGAPRERRSGHWGAKRKRRLRGGARPVWVAHRADRQREPAVVPRQPRHRRRGRTLRPIRLGLGHWGFQWGRPDRPGRGCLLRERLRWGGAGAVWLTHRADRRREPAVVPRQPWDHRGGGKHRFLWWRLSGWISQQQWRRHQHGQPSGAILGGAEPHSACQETLIPPAARRPPAGTVGACCNRWPRR